MKLAESSGNSESERTRAGKKEREINPVIHCFLIIGVAKKNFIGGTPLFDVGCTDDMKFLTPLNYRVK